MEHFLVKVGFYQLSKPGEEESLVRYEVDPTHGFKANVTYNNPSSGSSAYHFHNRQVLIFNLNIFASVAIYLRTSDFAK